MDISKEQLRQLNLVHQVISGHIQQISSRRSLGQQQNTQVKVDLIELDLFWTKTITTKDAESLKIYYTAVFQKLRSLLSHFNDVGELAHNLWFIKIQVERILTSISADSIVSRSRGLICSLFFHKNDPKKNALQNYLIKFAATKLEKFNNIGVDSTTASKETTFIQNQAKAAIAVLAGVMSYKQTPQQMLNLPSAIHTLFTTNGLEINDMIHANLCLKNNRNCIADCTGEYDPSKLSNWFNEHVPSFSSKGKRTTVPLHEAIKGMLNSKSIDPQFRGSLMESKKYLPENILAALDLTDLSTVSQPHL
jgi:hypothetical protein